eukprot:1937661-Rhodomonas_salina.2
MYVDTRDARSCAGVWCGAMHGTEIAYGVQCAVLRQRMVSGNRWRPWAGTSGSLTGPVLLYLSTGFLRSRSSGHRIARA